jgi:hypothetical protein
MMLDEELRGFQAEVRSFCSERLPASIRRKVELQPLADAR